VVGLRSIGFRKLYARVFALTGVRMCDDDMTSLFLVQKILKKCGRDCTIARRV
jgi:hypothetical protein